MVLNEVENERRRQDEKWGEQNHPSIHPVVAYMKPHEINGFFSIPSADTMREACEWAFKAKQGTYAHILLEEVCEAIEKAADEDELREELIQVAAVAVAWVEAIDRRQAKAKEAACRT